MTQVKAAYDAVAEDYADLFPSTDTESPIELAMIDHFVSLLSGTRPSVLDAGCGAGRMLPVLAEAGCSPIGMDLSGTMIKRARRDHPDFDTCIGSIAELPFAQHSFDGLFYWYSTIHTPNDELGDVLQEAHRVVRPHGHVLVAFQVGESTCEVGQGYRRLGHDVELFRHDRTPDVVVRELELAGFAEVGRLVRGPSAGERSAQTVLVARAVDQVCLPRSVPAGSSSVSADCGHAGFIDVRATRSRALPADRQQCVVTRPG